MDNHALNKRVTLFCGHYGSGKTNIAVNWALHLRRLGHEVAIADIDVVNPYFRTKDSQAELVEAGVEVVALPFANTSVDLPSLPAEVYGLVQRRDKKVVMDIGGDDRGAYALGRYRPYILEENDFANLFVANFYRPLTTTAEDAFEIMREIEAAAGIPFTGIVNNSNIGVETRLCDIVGTFPMAEKLSELSGLPIVMTTAEATLCKKEPQYDFFELELQKKLF
ncbi:MAG: hypothetical protein IJN71_01765 [Oscillospiraceae bacterium]|nr:hypothetical protein [Oscillospiraceae bacterium]